MTYTEIKELCRLGKWGLIPNWHGYLRWDYAKDELCFVNNLFKMSQGELEGNYGISNRTDLYYIT